MNVGQPAPKAASKLSHEARRSSEECVGSHESHSPNHEPPRFAMVRKFSFSFCLVLVILASHFRARRWTSRKKSHLESRLNQRDRATGGFVRVYTHRKPGIKLYCRGFLTALPKNKKKARRPAELSQLRRRVAAPRSRPRSNDGDRLLEW